MIPYLLAIGFVSILGQVVVLRELSVAFFGVELIYILAIGFWLLWSSVGAALGRKDYVPSERIIRSVFLAMSLLLLLDIGFIRLLRPLFGGIPGSYLPFHWQMMGIIVALLPISGILGLLFQWVAKQFIQGSGSLAVAYAVECAGGLLGGLASTLLLTFGVQNFTAAVLCSLLIVLTLLLPLRTPKKIPWRAGALAAVSFIPLLVFSPSLDLWLTRMTHPGLVQSRDSPYSRITVTRQGTTQYIVFEDDVLGFETESVEAEELVHPAALQVPQPRRFLLLGSLVGGELAEILKYGPSRVDVVEHNPVLAALGRDLLRVQVDSALARESVRLHASDPRRFVEEAGCDYDVILVGGGPPESGRSNRLYTKEFFQQCSEILDDRGVLAFRLPASENVWTRFTAYRMAAIHRSLEAAFSDSLVLPGRSQIFLASESLLPRDPAVSGDRLQALGISNRLVVPQYLSYLYTNDRFFETRSLLEATEVSPNLDLHPVCYRYSIMIWLSRLMPSVTRLDLDGWLDVYGSQKGGMVLLALLGVVLLVARRRPGLRRVLLVAFAGLIGMILETVFVLHYQVRNGILYQNIGLLLTLLMGGLSVGAWMVHSTLQRCPRRLHRWLAPVLPLGLCGLSAGYVALIHAGFALGLSGDCFFLFGTGFLVAGIFAFASESEIGDQRMVVSPLYAADLLGGCVGSLLASLILIPYLGLTQTALGMLFLAALAVILL